MKLCAEVIYSFQVLTTLAISQPQTKFLNKILMRDCIEYITQFCFKVPRNLVVSVMDVGPVNGPGSCLGPTDDGVLIL